MKEEFQNNGMYLEQNPEAPENGDLKNFDDDGRPKRTGTYIYIVHIYISFLP